MNKLNATQEEAFKSVVDFFKKTSWDVRSYSNLENTLLVERGDLNYIIHLFFGNTEGFNSWTPLNGESSRQEPSWESHSGHCVSPVYQLEHHIKNYSITKHKPFILLMTGAHVDVQEKELKKWKPITVLSSEKLFSIPRLERLGSLRSDLFDVTHPLRRFEPLDFQQMRDWTSEKARTFPLDISMNDLLADTNDSEDEEVSTFKYNLRFALDVPSLDRSNRPLEPSLGTYFRPSRKEGSLLVYLQREGKGEEEEESDSDTEYEFILRDKDHNTISLIKTKSSAFDNPIKLNFSEIEKGHLTLDIVNLECNRSVRCIRFTVKAGPVSHTDCLRLLYFGLFRMDEGSDNDLESLLKVGAKRSFDGKNLSGVRLIAEYKNALKENLEGQFVTRVTTYEGDCVYENAEVTMISGEDRDLVQQDLCGFEMNEGRYIVTISFFGEVIAKARFSIGEDDVPHSFKTKHVETKNRTAARVRDGNKTPQERLNAMIGLERLKKDLQGIIAQVKLERAREKLGFTVTSRPLHLAFLGNPGTGKTTIAKILGQIYKEIGVLSKGQVVIKERANLLGQNWNAEGDNTRAAVSESKGGILFIDEAYDLVTEHPHDPGKQVVSALLSKMADERWRDWMVVFAGYTAPMEKFLSSNPGLRSRLNCVYFDDYNEEELIQIADLWLEEKQYSIEEEARTLLKMNIASAYANRNEEFGNARYISTLLTNEVLKNMAIRLENLDNYEDTKVVSTIVKEDIPNYHQEKDAHEAMSELNSMIGLSSLKSELTRHLRYISVLNARRKQGVYTKLPPLHMIFTGNPGTGKTSVATYLGKIYKSMGILSKGNVVMASRADVVGFLVGETEKNMKDKIREAQGNILFIDEAYNLAKINNSNDDGYRVLELLLTVIGQESCDMIVIMAGYEKEMMELMNTNPGLKGRFSKTFNFPDYDEKELYKIAMAEASRHKLSFTPDAQEALRALIKREHQEKDEKFSNGRFAVRLVSTELMLSMAERLGEDIDMEKLNIITREDIPVSDEEVKMINENSFDEALLETALNELDGLVGLEGVKKSLHQFVDFVRALHARGDRTMENYPLKWSFVGNFGTGKGTIARILTSILKGLRLIKMDKLVKVEAEEIIGSTSYNSAFMTQKVSESKNGMLFVNGVSSLPPDVGRAISPMELRAIGSVFVHERGSRAAMILAENDSPRAGLSKSLAKIGIYSFDYTLIFEDYSDDELLQLLHVHLGKLGLKLNKKSTTLMKEYITKLSSGDQAHQANSHTIRLLSFALQRLSIASNSNTIEADLVVDLVRTVSEYSNRLGF